MKKGTRETISSESSFSFTPPPFAASGLLSIPCLTSYMASLKARRHQTVINYESSCVVQRHEGGDLGCHEPTATNEPLIIMQVHQEKGCQSSSPSRTYFPRDVCGREHDANAQARIER